MFLWIGGCTVLDLDPPRSTAWVVFDPANSTIPLPNDLLRDATAGHLALPIDGGASAAEAALREALNAQDGWSSASPITFALSEPADPTTVSAQTVSVWEWGASPGAVTVTPTLSEDGLTVEILPPNDGWGHGGRYAVYVSGLQTTGGTSFGPDAAFAYLRGTEPLTAHPDAFPGDTRDAREQSAAALEAYRNVLAPFLDGGPFSRDELDAAWSFTVTVRPELAMDEASSRMPLPFDLLIDPATGLVALPADPEDSAVEAEAKRVVNARDGFGITPNLMFEATAALDPRTVHVASVELWDVTRAPVRIPASVAAWRDEGPCAEADDGCRYVRVDPDGDALVPGSTYAVVVRDAVSGRDGAPLAAMPLGHLLRGEDPVWIDGTQVGGLSDGDAERIEGVRADVDALLDALGREGIVTAWPFTTSDPLDALAADVAGAAFSEDLAPTITDRGPPFALFDDDPLSDLFPGIINPVTAAYLPRVDGVAEVIEGTIRTPDHLHPVTRRWVEQPTLRDLHFLLTLPEAPAAQPVPVLIFGHAIVTDRRFALTVSGAFAARGFAVISVDFPYHGERIACVDASLVAVPNFFPPDLQDLVGLTDPLLYASPCVSGDAATCAPTGECLDANGLVEPFAAFPLVDIRPAAGAAFLDVYDLPHIPDHFRQALVDLGALRASLQQEDWAGALGRPLDTSQIGYIGQSLGGIIGAVYVAADPQVNRVVLNVAGGNLVDLFSDSTFFGPQMDEYLASIDVAKGTWEHERLLNVARWIMDGVDPLAVAHVYAERNIDGLIQMDRVDETLGDIVIPNATTDALAAATGLPVLEYPSVLHGDLVIPLVGDAMLNDAADFFAETP